MKYLTAFVFLIILYGCGTTPKKTEESLPSFTLTNNFRYNEQISYYTSKNGILKDSVGLSFKELGIKNTEGKNIFCKYKLAGGRSYESDPEGQDNRDDLVRQVDCSFGILDTSNGFSWQNELVNDEEILSLLSMNFELISEKERFYSDSAQRIIIGFKNRLNLLLKEEMSLKKKYKGGYSGSVEEKNDLLEIEEENNKIFAISTGDKVIAIVQLIPQSKRKYCTKITYKSYQDWEKSASLNLAIVSMRIYRLKNEIGL